jgi:hypothetical protein
MRPRPRSTIACTHGLLWETEVVELARLRLVRERGDEPLPGNSRDQRHSQNDLFSTDIGVKPSAPPVRGHARELRVVLETFDERWLHRQWNTRYLRDAHDAEHQEEVSL